MDRRSFFALIASTPAIAGWLSRIRPQFAPSDLTLSLDEFSERVLMPQTFWFMDAIDEHLRTMFRTYDPLLGLEQDVYT
jgi:hypothetical protein